MKQPRPGIRSTRKNIKESNGEPVEIEHIAVHPNATQTTMIPPDNDSNGNIFCFTALANKQQGTLYTNATGVLPLHSLDGNQYFSVAYDYDNNYVFAEPIPNEKYKSIVDTFQRIFNILVEKGHWPLLNITDNQGTAPLKTFLKSERCK